MNQICLRAGSPAEVGFRRNWEFRGVQVAMCKSLHAGCDELEHLVASLDDEYAAWRSGLDIVLLECFHDAAAEFTADVVLPARAGAPDDEVVDLAVGHAVDAEHAGWDEEIRREWRFGGQGFSHLPEQGHDLFAGLGVGGSGTEQDLRPVARHVGDELDLAIRDSVDGAVVVAQDGAAERHVFHSTFDGGSADGITNIVLVLEQDEEAVDDVLDQRLRAEADSQSGNACAGQYGAEVEADLGENFQRGHEIDDELADAIQDPSHGFDLARAHIGIAVGNAEGAHAVRDGAEYPQKQKGNQQDEDDLGQVVLHELVRVLFPLAQEFLEVEVFRKHEGQGCHAWADYNNWAEYNCGNGRSLRSQHRALNIELSTSNDLRGEL